MFYGWLDSAVRDIFESTYVNSKIGPLKSTLDGNKDIENKKKFAIFGIRWCKTSVISNICLGNRIWRSHRYIRYCTVCIARNIEYRSVNSNIWKHIFDVTGWQRPLISNLRGGCRKGRGPYLIIIHKMTMYIRIYVFEYINSIF
jgi:hypothetical protein